MIPTGVISTLVGSLRTLRTLMRRQPDLAGVVFAPTSLGLVDHRKVGSQPNGGFQVQVASPMAKTR